MATMILSERDERSVDGNGLLRSYFAACIAIITTISIYDAYLVVLYRYSIRELEHNPICLALIEFDPTGLKYFLVGKAIGTLCVISILTMLYMNRKKSWLFVSTSITAFQIALLGFLTFGEPL
jgi:hypothetical protein